jgi:two-component system, OmpR family, response regulator VicR
MKVLLVEDHKEISKNIREYLELEGFFVETAFDGLEGLEKSLAGNHDVILLDLMLPKFDGIELSKKIHSKKATPIIMITARESIDERLIGFASWAIDYLVKPFDLRELVARIMVHTHSIDPTKKYYENTELSLDFEKRVFLKNNTVVHLTQKEFLILENIFEKKESVVTRSAIIEYLWGEDGLFEGGDNKLDVYISNIRQKLGKNIITTIKWVGYTFWK